MMLIVNFGQVVDLEHGEGFMSQFTVLLQDGSRISVKTDEATIEQLTAIAGGLVHEGEVSGGNNHPQMDMEQQVRQLGLQHPHLQAVPDIPLEGIPEPEGDEFGGDYDPGEEAEVPSGAAMGTIAEQRVATHQGLGGLGAPMPPQPAPPPQQPAIAPPRPQVDADGYLVPPRPRTVPKDEMGYPVVAQKSAARPTVGEDDDDGTQI